MKRAKPGNRRSIRIIRASRKAQMPFSIVAVLLLVLSSASIALVYGLDTWKETSSLPEETLRQMRRCIDDAHRNVVRMAYSAAIEAVQATKDLNEGEVNERFRTSLNASLVRAYPSLDGNIMTEVEHDLKLLFLRASLQESYATYGEDLASWERASVPSYFTVTGNCSIEVSCSGGRLSKNIELDQDIYVPLPLLIYRLDHLSRSAVPRGELESVVRYELSALVQDRVLRGYGMTAKTGAWSTEAVLTNEDVVRAVNLALLLEELRYFQDTGALPGTLNGLGPLLANLEGPVDPADLFLRSYDMGGIDLAPLVAQTINARADAIVLKWMDYFGFIDLLDLGEDELKNAAWALADVLDVLTGGDSDQDMMKRYLSKALADGGFPEYLYRWFCFGGPDVIVEIPQRKISFLDDGGNLVYRTFQGTYALDLIPVDIYSSPAWGDLFRRYARETHVVAEAMRAFLEAIASGVASHCSLPVIELSLDPLDDRNYLSELDEQLSRAFRDGSMWLKPAIDRVNQVNQVRDGLAQATMDFIDRYWSDLLQMNASFHQAATDLSWKMAYQLNGTPDLSPASMAEARRIIYMELEGDHWGAKEKIMNAIWNKAAPIMDMFNKALSNKYRPVDPMSQVLAFGISCLPGLERLTAGALTDTVDGLRDGLASQGGPVLVPVSQGGLTLTLADGQQRTERITADHTSFRLGSDGRPGSLDVDIKEPWDFDRGNTSYPNRHVTNLLNMTATPYMTEWGIRYHGVAEVTIRAGHISGQRLDLPCSAMIVIDGDIKIMSFSGWGLEGVAYSPTATLARDVMGVVTQVWDFMVASVQAVGGLVGKAFTLFCQLVDDLLSYATKPLELLNQLLMATIGSLNKVADTFLELVIEAMSDATVWALNGTKVDLSIFGLNVVLLIGPGDSALAGAEDHIRTDISLSCLGATLVSSVRVLKLANGEKTIVGTATLGGDDWSVDLTLDPRTQVYPHQVEVRGFLGGHIIEIVSPVMERVQKASFALSDIPGVSAALSAIPSPVPGTRMQFDAGIELRFNVLDRSDVLINEVELNPRGKDSSQEWVELFNPSDRAVELNGWTLQTVRGRQHAEALRGSVPARGYYVHMFTGQALDNGDVKGFPVQESVVLLDHRGKRVDSAPWLKDLGDDERTWQRAFDGSSHWELVSGTRGASNGFVLINEQNLDGLVALLGECFAGALDQFMSSGLDARSLNDIIKGTLLRFEERLLDMVEESISSLKFFIRLGLIDGTGTAGAGINVALVYDGRAVRECLHWLVSAVGDVISDPLNPMAGALRAKAAEKVLADHVFVQVGAFVTVGASSLLKNLIVVRVTATAMIKASLGTMGALESDGNSRIDFGLVVSGLQGVKLKLPAGSSTEASYDVWLLRGSIRPA